MPVWEALEAEGLITRLLPDWERVRCRPQRNAVHRWTVDRHLVETAVRAAELTREVDRPDLLLIGALLHDIGKGWPGDHSAAGEVIARDVAARLGFGRADVDVLALLVRHHLLLIETATRRDLDDPATVEAVAKTVESRQTLDLLHALTEADALATGPAAWSAWRASLVADLVRRVAGVLAGEVTDTAAAPAPSAEEERLAVEAARTQGLVLALHAEAEAVGPDEADEGTEPVGVELLLAVPDRPGLLPAAAGVLALHRLTVRAADLRRVDPIGAGPVTLLSWRVAAEYGSLPEAARLRADFVRAFDGSLDIGARLAEREAAYPRRRGVPAPPAAGDRRGRHVAARHRHRGPRPRRAGAAAPDRRRRWRTRRTSPCGPPGSAPWARTRWTPSTSSAPTGRPSRQERARQVARAVQEALG